MSTPRPLAPRLPTANQQARSARAVMGRAPSFTIVAVRESAKLHNIGSKCVIGPILTRVQHVPGVNGVRTKKQDGVRIGDPSIALKNIPSDRIALPHANEPGGRTFFAFGEEMPDYCVAYTNRSGGRHHVMFYTRPIPGSKRVEIDEDAYAEFLEWAQQIAGNPHQVDIDDIRRQLQFRRLSLPAKAERNASAAKRLQSIDHALSVFKAPEPAPVSAPAPTPAVDPRDAELAALRLQLAALSAKTTPPAEPGSVELVSIADEFDFENNEDSEEPVETKPPRALL